MKTLRMYGHSDDCLEVEGLPGSDEFNPMNRDLKVDGKSLSMAVVQIGNGVQTICILAIYVGQWTFAHWREDDTEDKFPSFPVRITPSKDSVYSACFELDVPDDFVVLRVGDTATGADPKIVAALATLKAAGVKDGEAFEDLVQKAK